MDGLLIDSERLALHAFQDTCEKFQLGDLTEIFLQCIGTNTQLGTTILKNGLQGIMDHEEFGREWYEKYKKLSKEKPAPLKEGAQDLLQQIKTGGTPMMVATSTRTDHAKLKLRDSGIIHYFHKIIGGDQVSKSKPDPEIYLRAASELSLAPADCLALEDSPNGVRAAVAAGFTVIQIPDLIEPDECLLKMGHMVLSSLSEVQCYAFQR